MNNLFSLSDKVFVITGGAGLLGCKHAEAILEQNGLPILLDIDSNKLSERSKHLYDIFNINVPFFICDITNKAEVQNTLQKILILHNRVDGLINNAANNPQVSGDNTHHFERFESLHVDRWFQDINVGLTGAFLCSQVFGSHMASNKSGVILNIASDLSVIAPDQRLYQIPGIPIESQPCKPVTYSVVKTGLHGLTRYLSTYWNTSNIRVNSLSPGGVYNNQDSEFVEKITKLIPLSRMAAPDEYKGSVIFLLSEASAYLTGFNLVVDGGRSVW